MADNLRCLASLPQLRIRQTLKNSDTADDQRMLAKLRAASNEIERFTVQDFQPTIETRTFDWGGASYLSFRSQKALSLTSVTDGIGQVVPTSAMLQLGSRNSAWGTPGPVYGIESVPALGGYFFYQYTKRRCMLVNGTWGWHNDYANAWVDSNVQVGAGGWLTATAGSTSTLQLCSTNDGTITDAYGRNWNITQPVVASYGTVHVGHLIQVDTEWMQVVAAPDSTHLTLVRGVNGSTPTAHNAGIHISIYNVPSDINDICITWASRLYYQDSTGSNSGVSMRTFGRGAGKPQSDLYADLKDSLSAYLSLRVS